MCIRGGGQLGVATRAATQEVLAQAPVRLLVWGGLAEARTRLGVGSCLSQPQSGKSRVDPPFRNASPCTSRLPSRHPGPLMTSQHTISVGANVRRSWCLEGHLGFSGRPCRRSSAQSAECDARSSDLSPMAPGGGVEPGGTIWYGKPPIGLWPPNSARPKYSK